jgi:CRISPR/Cas system CSM-associated protein Csm3 (group 7 of RAMP superfamily)
MKRRVTYQGRLRLPCGFHTGDGRRLGVADQPLFLDQDGAVVLAGTSLAGVLRADLLRLVRECDPRPYPRDRHRPDCSCVVCRLMGPEAPERRSPGEEEGPSLRASRLYVSGGRAEGGAIRVQDHVGIDRRTRTAADRRKYDVEVVEGGLEIPFTLRLDEPADDELSYLEASLKRLAQGWLFLGGKTGGGLGRAELLDLARFDLDLAATASLVEHLLADDPAAGCSHQILLSPSQRAWSETWDLPPEGTTAGWAQLRLRLELELPWGFLVNAPPEAAMQGFDQAFARLPDGRPLLPGSSLRGALRSRAEQVLRTFGGPAAACDLNRAGCSCHDRVEKENERRKEQGKPLLTFREELEQHCLACQVFGSGRYASPVKLTDFHALEDRRGEPVAHELVAIDRFTGGAAPQHKFDAESSAGPTLAGEIHLELGSDRLTDWGLGLLALVLRDLLLGDVPLGFGTARGFNEYQARITGGEAFWLHLPDLLMGGLGLPANPGNHRWRPGEEIASPAAAARVAGEALARLIERWVEALHQRLAKPAAPPDESSAAMEEKL